MRCMQRGWQAHALGHLHNPKCHVPCMQGRWTAEEEAKLLELAAHKPGRWAEIGTALGRLPEGVRDKHRLLTGIAGGARKGRWNADEEAKLVELVEAFLAERQVILGRMLARFWRPLELSCCTEDAAWQSYAQHASSAIINQACMVRAWTISARLAHTHTCCIACAVHVLDKVPKHQIVVTVL